ncbi:unnamed protein product [Choristocarpus tenellus]
MPNEVKTNSSSICVTQPQHIHTHFNPTYLALVFVQTTSPLAGGPNLLALLSVVTCTRVETSQRVLGDVFLRAFYTAYNPIEQKFGLAPSTGERTSAFCEDDKHISSAGGPSPAKTTNPPATASPPIRRATPAPCSAVNSAANSDSSDDDKEGSWNGLSSTMVAVGFFVLLIVAFAILMLCLIALQRRRAAGVTRGGYKQAKFRSEGEVEIQMSSGGRGGRITSFEDDFVPAHPGSYQGKSSGSHMYRASNNSSGEGGEGSDYGDNVGEDEFEMQSGLVASPRRRGFGGEHGRRALVGTL